MLVTLFNILDYLDRLDNVVEQSTWIQATCPVCGGSLKISKNPTKHGAYACYTNNCHQKNGNLIRNKLYKKKPFSKSSAFKNKAKKVSTLVSLVEPIPIDTDASSFISDVTFTMPEQIRTQGKLFTYFDYGSFRMVRLDLKNPDGTKEKYIYPEYFNRNKYVKGLPSVIPDLPIYTDRYIQESMIFVEGEKVATIGQMLKLATATFPTFAFSEEALKKCAVLLKKQGVKNVLYLADNDEAGKHKAELICNYFWYNGIGTKAINLADVFTDFRRHKGFDLYDAYKAGLVTAENSTQVIENLLISDK